MAKAIPPAAIALYGKAGAFEMSRVPCIERYSQFIASLAEQRELSLSSDPLYVFIINLCTTVPKSAKWN